MQLTNQNVFPQYEEHYFRLYFGQIVEERVCLRGQGTFWDKIGFIPDGHEMTF